MKEEWAAEQRPRGEVEWGGGEGPKRRASLEAGRSEPSPKSLPESWDGWGGCLWSWQSGPAPAPPRSREGLCALWHLKCWAWEAGPDGAC